MNQPLSPLSTTLLGKLSIAGFITIILALSGVVTIYAQGDTDERVQILDGSIFRKEDQINYLISDLNKGDRLYIYVQGTSGNLDPFIALQSSSQLPATIANDFHEHIRSTIDNNIDPLPAIEEFADQNFMAWDDDSGAGFSASLEFVIPANGDYQLAVMSSPIAQSSGDYELTVGINAPDVLMGKSVAQGDDFVVPTIRKVTKNVAVQEVIASLGGETPTQLHRLTPFSILDTLYVYVETIEGDLIPQITLRAYGTKPIRSANNDSNFQQASLEYTFTSEESDYLVEVIAKESTSGTYKLIVSRNEPGVLVGEATPFGGDVLQQPIIASVGIKLQQIANINQQSENYDAVATTEITWNDPALAFSPDQCQCESKIFSVDDFVDFAKRESLRWPAITYLNQQNARWIQNDHVVVYPNGDAKYFERFTTTFQVPGFDFRQFPFDNQTFHIRIDSLFSTDFVQFVASDFSEVGTQLGEEEWYVSDAETELISEPGSTGKETSSFIFWFFAGRHISFYIFRIFVPLILIISITWITFFIPDYGRRIDVSTANLLLFIAFNFTIANDLPRLGYLTYMDALLVSAFFISVVVVFYNVYLRRQEKLESQNWAQRLDKHMIWIYPLGYFIALFGITWYFFWR